MRKMAGMTSKRRESIKAWLTLAVATLVVCAVMAGLALPIVLCGGDPAAQQTAVTAVV